LVFDEGMESADIAKNENILLLDVYSKVKLFEILELIRGAQCLIEVIGSSGEEM
jgi:hypothetical protein